MRRVTHAFTTSGRAILGFSVFSALEKAMKDKEALFEMLSGKNLPLKGVTLEGAVLDLGDHDIWLTDREIREDDEPLLPDEAGVALFISIKDNGTRDHDVSVSYIEESGRVAHSCDFKISEIADELKKFMPGSGLSRHAKQIMRDLMAPPVVDFVNKKMDVEFFTMENSAPEKIDIWLRAAMFDSYFLFRNRKYWTPDSGKDVLDGGPGGTN